MNDRIHWAFSQPELNSGEKLILVWLAWRAGSGAAILERDLLAQASDYEPRSLQRILKTLRDRGLLHEAGDWYAVGQTPGGEAPAFPPADMQPLGADMRESLARELPLMTDQELGRIEDALAKAITEAGDGLITRFNDVSLRLLQGIEKIAQAARVWEESVADAVAPAPDPVRESTHFKAFMLGGVLTEPEAYELARKRLEAEGVLAGPGPSAAAVLPVAVQTLVPKGRQPLRDTRQYLDSPLGRFERVRDILDPAGTEPWADAMTVWSKLEASENKHSVEGESTGFELLYPAIVTAARRSAGLMSVAQFLDEKAIAANRAPWDQAPAVANNDAQLQVELANMLDELERASHPMAIAPGRTVEGSLTESLASYHLRVKRVHQQLKKLQEMGV
jgi:hypothetical protein